MLILELLDNPVDNHLVKVITAQMSVTICRHHLKHTVSNLQHSEVRSTATNIGHHNLLRLVCVDTIGKGCRSRFIDDPLHIETRNLTGILHSLASSVIIIGGTGDDCISHRLAKIILRSLLHLLENHSGQFLR